MIKIVKNILVVGLVATSMSGCGLYSKFEQTADDSITDNLFNYIEATSDTTSIASLGWREIFTDAQLQSLVEQALENNTDLNVARLNVEQAQIALKKSRKAYTPTLDLSLDGGIKHVGGTTTNSYGATLSSGWDIDVFGKLYSAKLQSKAALEQSIAYQRAVQTQLVATVATNYYSLLMLDEQLKISRRSLEMWDANLRTTEALNRAGRVNNTAVLQSAANKSALESSIISLEEQIKVAENNISTILLIAPQHIERSTITDVEFPEELSVGQPLQLVANRPDVQYAEFELAQAFYAVGVARASMYPALSLSGSISYSDGSGVVTNPGELIYNLAASVLQPIFNRGVLRAELQISKSQQEQALLQFNQAVLDAGAEVNIALVECQSAKARMVKDLEQIKLLTEAVRNTELLMTHGTSTYLEVLTAQQSLLSAELSYASTKFELSEGVINLYYALGGGVE
ncbi:MAG: TolC family protein [Rikenellaceae bacterium]